MSNGKSDIDTIIKDSICGIIFSKNTAQAKLLKVGINPDSVLPRVINDLKNKGYEIVE